MRYVHPLSAVAICAALAACGPNAPRTAAKTQSVSSPSPFAAGDVAVAAPTQSQFQKLILRLPADVPDQPADVTITTFPGNPDSIDPEAVCLYDGESAPQEMQLLKLAIKNHQLKVNVQPGRCHSFWVATDDPHYVLVNQWIDSKTRYLNVDERI
ncbi:MAG: hypothetical protein ACREP7_07000 [Lysobacter sp.]